MRNNDKGKIETVHEISCSSWISGEVYVRIQSELKWY
jgi:hypothetical protein